eukprot:225158-Amphidinium_carterae.1
MDPFNPRLASEIWSRSVPGAMEVTLGVFSSPTTLSQLAGVTWEEYTRRLSTAVKDLQSAAQRWPLFSENSRLGEKWWASPHLILLSRLVQGPADKVDVSKPHMVLYMPGVGADDPSRLEKRGGSPGYPGCTTSAKVVGQVVHVRSTQRAFRDALGWFETDIEQPMKALRV